MSGSCWRRLSCSLNTFIILSFLSIILEVWASTSAISSLSLFRERSLLILASSISLSNFLATAFLASEILFILSWNGLFCFGCNLTFESLSSLRSLSISFNLFALFSRIIEISSSDFPFIVFFESCFCFNCTFLSALTSSFFRFATLTSSLSTNSFRNLIFFS